MSDEEDQKDIKTPSETNRLAAVGLDDNNNDSAAMVGPLDIPAAVSCDWYDGVMMLELVDG